MRLQTRLNLAFTSLVLIVLAVGSLVIYSLILDLLVKNEETQLEQKGELLVQFLEENANYNNSVDELEKFLSEQNLQFIVYDQTSDQVLMSTLSLDIVDGFYKKDYFVEEESGLWEYTGSKFVVSKKRIAPNQSGLELILLTPLTDLQVVQQSFISRIALVFIIGSLIAILLSYFVTGKLVTPLERLKVEVKKIERREFSELKDIKATGEIKEVALSVNEMGLELQRYIDSQQTFFQNASHELKTPLMTIQGYAEGIRDGIFTDEDEEKGLNVIASEVKRLKILINEMTLLAKLDSEKSKAEQEEIDLNDLIEKAVDRVRPYAIEQSINIEYTNDNSIMIVADEDKLLRAILNVMMNGVRYAHSNVEITVEDRKDKVAIIIADDGSGVDEKILPYLFHRFVKGHTGDTGLGLAISRAIIEQIDGHITVKNRPNSGAEFMLELNQKKKV
ncbi:MAG TPA: HAMP domain-containing sensor histidine kinase [Pseudogracilibacillus sp.]|nr:HAMP domain-containing sensor histidine kinase [Pseudogracilibacillus sp.]